MFTATKLRRGMIPKDKEGECWTLSHGGRAMCHHSLLLTTTLVILLLVGAAFCWQKDHYAHTLSMTHLLACPLSRSWMFIHLHVDWVKRIHNSLFEGSVLLFLTDCWPVNMFSSPLPQVFVGLRIDSFLYSCRVLCLFPSLSDDVLSCYFHRWIVAVIFFDSSVGCVFVSHA